MMYFVRVEYGGPILVKCFDGVPESVCAEIAARVSPLRVKVLAVVPGGEVEVADFRRQFESARIDDDWYKPTSKIVAHIASVGLRGKSIVLDDKRVASSRRNLNEASKRDRSTSRFVAHLARAVLAGHWSVRFGSGSLWVNAGALRAGWSEVSGFDPPPSASQIGRWAGGLAVEEKRLQRRPSEGPGRADFYRLDVDRVVGCIRMNAVAADFDVDRFCNLIAAPPIPEETVLPEIPESPPKWARGRRRLSQTPGNLRDALAEIAVSAEARAGRRERK